MLTAVPHSAQKKLIMPGWLPIRAMLATCCAVEPLHGSECATITVRRNANAAAVTIQLLMLVRLLPAKLRRLACPVLMPVPAFGHHQGQFVPPASSRRGSKRRSSRPGTWAVLDRAKQWCGPASSAPRSADILLTRERACGPEDNGTKSICKSAIGSRSWNSGGAGRYGRHVARGVASGALRPKATCRKGPVDPSCLRLQRKEREP
jgi:hypothetical protein